MKNRRWQSKFFIVNISRRIAKNIKFPDGRNRDKFPGKNCQRKSVTFHSGAAAERWISYDGRRINSISTLGKCFFFIFCNMEKKSYKKYAKLQIERYGTKRNRIEHIFLNWNVLHMNIFVRYLK